MSTAQANELLSLPLDDLISQANNVRRKSIGKHIETCGIINAKSGRCSEDCKFCAQSAHYFTNVQEYSLKDKEKIVEAARQVKNNGARRFGIVTSGRRLVLQEIKVIADAIQTIQDDVGILPCASLGALSEEFFTILKNAGLTRYHHNIETSERFYPSIVSTHDYSERVNTIKRAKKMELEVCSGGILGMGETWQDRLDMASLLKELEVDSVPLNFLVPVKGTPLENVRALSPLEAIRIIAIFRIILENTIIKVAAGRESVLKDFQVSMYTAGANGMMVGGYLTIKGQSLEEDQALVSKVQKLWNEE